MTELIQELNDCCFLDKVGGVVKTAYEKCEDGKLRSYPVWCDAEDCDNNSFILNDSYKSIVYLEYLRGSYECLAKTDFLRSRYRLVVWFNTHIGITEDEMIAQLVKKVKPFGSIVGIEKDNLFKKYTYEKKTNYTLCPFCAFGIDFEVKEQLRCEEIDCNNLNLEC